MATTTLIRNGLIVTMNARHQVLRGDILLQEQKIAKISARPLRALRGARVMDATDCFVIPGLIQAHIHLCQTLFRGLADDLPLLDWLRKKIWPMEAAHTPASLRAAAELGLLELQLNGTTAILDMGTVQHTQTLLETAAASGIRYWGGKCLMDRKDSSGPLFEPLARAMRESEELISEWHGRHPRVQYALCPRFAISCSEPLMQTVREWQEQFAVIMHTHASENRDEIKLIRKRTGMNNVDYFASLGLLGPRSVIAHGVHLTDREARKMARARASLVHCPSSNLKLASGLAPITRFRRLGLNVALGADGAPCNNSLDPFLEMRLAALVQKPMFGSTAMAAREALHLCTRAGARALGIEKQAGSLEPGKNADLVIVERSHPGVATVEDPYSALVYSCLGRDVRDVMVGGDLIVREKEHQRFDADAVVARARLELGKLLRRL